jgi:hypothetical protein
MEENTSTLDIRAINEKKESAFIDLLTMEMNKVKRHMIERLLIGLWPRTFC